MSFWPTLIAAIILMVFVVLALAIGKLITGKNRLHKKCGWTPKTKDTDQKCDFCGRSSSCSDDLKDEDQK